MYILICGMPLQLDTNKDITTDASIRCPGEIYSKSNFDFSLPLK